MNKSVFRTAAIALAIAAAASAHPATAQTDTPEACDIRQIPVETKQLAFSMRIAPDRRSAVVWENGILANDDPDPALRPLRLINLESGEGTTTFSGNTDFAGEVQFTPNGQQLVSYHTNGQIYVWNARNGNAIRTLQATIGAYRFALAPNNRTMYVLGSGPEQIQQWDLSTGAITRLFGRTFATLAEFRQFANSPLSLNGSQLVAVDVSRDGTRLITSSFNDEVALWDLKTFEKTVLAEGGDRPLLGIRTVRFSPDGTRVAWYKDAREDASDTTTIVDVGTGKTVRTIEAGGPYFAFSSDGKSVIAVNAEATTTTTGAASRSISLVYIPSVESDDEESIVTFPLLERGNLLPGVDIAFSRDGESIVVGGIAGTAGTSQPIYVIPLTCLQSSDS